MPFERTCLYHPDLPVRVLEEDQEELYKQLKATGEWFNLPHEAKNYGQIRRKQGQGKHDGEHSPITDGSGTLSQKRIREKSANGTSKTSRKSAKLTSSSNAL